MNMVEKVFAEVRSLPEFELREVLDFVGFLKARHGGAVTQPCDHEPGSGDAEFDLLATATVNEPSKSLDLALMQEVRGKVRAGVAWTRDELYDRGLR